MPVTTLVHNLLIPVVTLFDLFHNLLLRVTICPVDYHTTFVDYVSRFTLFRYLRWRSRYVTLHSFFTRFTLICCSSTHSYALIHTTVCVLFDLPHTPPTCVTFTTRFRSLRCVYVDRCLFYYTVFTTTISRDYVVDPHGPTHDFTLPFRTSRTFPTFTVVIFVPVSHLRSRSAFYRITRSHRLLPLIPVTLRLQSIAVGTDALRYSVVLVFAVTYVTFFTTHRLRYHVTLITFLRSRCPTVTISRLFRCYG